MRAITIGCAVEITRPVHDETAIWPRPISAATAAGKAVNQRIRPTAIEGGQRENRTTATEIAVSGGAVQFARRRVKRQAGNRRRTVVSALETVKDVFCPST